MKKFNFVPLAIIAEHGTSQKRKKKLILLIKI